MLGVADIINNTLLAVDVDGTLLTDGKEVLDKDRTAIRELRESGGLFTIATGRAVSYTRPLVVDLGIDIPVVINNGAIVYDYVNERSLWQKLLPPNARELMLRIKERFPSLGVDILRGEDVFSISSNRHTEEHFRNIRLTPTRCSLDEVPEDDWSKILLVDEPEVIDEIVRYAEGLDKDGIRLVCSCPVFYEMLPDGVNKGTGIAKLLETAGLSGRYVVAAGDYLNDIEMIQMAELGVAVGNAADEVKKHADIIVCDNNSGAVYEIVQRLKGQSLFL